MNISALSVSFDIKSGAQPGSLNILEANALYYVISEFFLRTAPSVVLTLSCHGSVKCNIYNNILEKLLPMLDAVLLQIVIVKLGSKKRVLGERLHNVILVDSFQAFLDVDIIHYTSKYDYNEYLYIVLKTPDSLIPMQLQQILEYCWTNNIINCAVQVQRKDGAILVYTYFPYTEQHCGRVVPVLINQFNGSGFVEPVLFPKKLTNLHRCPLRAALFNAPPFMSLTTEGNTTSIKGGIEGTLLLQMALRYNFSIVVKVPPNDEQRGKFIGNITTGALNMLINCDVDFSLGAFRQSPQRNKVASSTSNYFQSYRAFAVYDPAYALTSYEIMVYPFQRSTWLLIFFIFLLSLLREALSKHSAMANEEFSSKKQHQHAYLDLFATLMGLSSIRVPKGTMGRITLLNWIIFALVIRTVYQGLMYHLIRTHAENRYPKSLQEVIDANYTAVMTIATSEALVDIQTFKQLHKLIINSSDETSSFSYVENMKSKKLIAMGPVDFLLYYAHSNKKLGIFKVLPQHLILYQITMYLCKHSHLIDHFNDQLLWIRANGLTYKWKNSEVDYTYLNNITIDRVFSMNEVYMIFVVYGVGLLIASALFLLELISCKCRLLRYILKNA